jgi:hypothetical protein
MSKILGYPRRMLPEYKKKWLPKFSSDDDITVEEHMSNFWDFFQLHPIDDEAEDLVMKVFSATLHDTTKIWYDGLPDKGIDTMEQFEETFMNRWGTGKDPNMLLQIP